MKLIEIFDSDDFIVETLELEKENKNVLAALHFPFILGDKKNANGRIYSSKILRREIERMQKRIAESGLPGQLDHPSFSGSTEITKITICSHLLAGMRRRRKGRLMRQF